MATATSLGVGTLPADSRRRVLDLWQAHSAESVSIDEAARIMGIEVVNA